MSQSDDSLVELLQSLADMDITFQALKVNYATIFFLVIFKLVSSK